MSSSEVPGSGDFWAFVAEALSPGSGATHGGMLAVGNLLSAQTFTPSAYCQAQRLKLDMLQLIAGQVAGSMERNVLKNERWRARRDVKIIDGTGLSMPGPFARQLLSSSSKQMATLPHLPEAMSA